MSAAAIYWDRVTRHAHAVVNGPERDDWGELHRLACERHLRDLAREKTPDFPFYWDPDAATRVLDFAETLTLAEGAEPKPLQLMDCQAFDIG